MVCGNIPTGTDICLCLERLLVALSRNTVKLTSLTVWGLIKVAVRAGT